MQHALSTDCAQDKQHVLCPLFFEKETTCATSCQAGGLMPQTHLMGTVQAQTAAQ